MTLDNYIELAVRGGGISLATYALIGHIVKPAIRMVAKRGGKRLSGRQEEFLRWLTRTMCILLGALLGALPLWPEWFAQEWWGVLLGAIGGSMAPAIHHAVAKTLPARIKKIISGGSISK
jgi:hypothetical protein